MIGIISIVLSSLYLLCTPIGLFTTPDANQQKMLAALPDWYSTVKVVLDVLAILAVVVLLVGGITLLKRRPLGRTCHLVYGWAVAAVSLLGTVIFVATFESSQMQSEMVPVVWGGIGCGTLFVLAYPAFVLIWFYRSKIKAEVQEWRQTTPLPPGILPS